MKVLNVNEIVNNLDLRYWKTKKEIMFELQIKGMKIDERTWRKVVEIHNESFWSHDNDKFIAHSQYGYKLTSDRDEIINSIEDCKQRALNMLWKYSQTRKSLNEKNNLRFELEEMGVI